MMNEDMMQTNLQRYITDIIGETNGITLDDTLALLIASEKSRKDPGAAALIREFRGLLTRFQEDQSEIQTLLNHPFSKALYQFFHGFPLHYREEHIHLTGSLTADFLYPKIAELLEGPGGEVIREKIELVYGRGSSQITGPADIDKLIRLKDHERFDRYLKILMLPKLILNSRQAHRDAAYHMAHELFHKHNVGKIRLKFTLSRATGDSAETIPGIADLTPDDVALGLYEGFQAFRREESGFEFILSPCFRKESDFYDHNRYETKRASVDDQVNTILRLLDEHPFLADHLREVDTVGNERDFYRKQHFNDLRIGFRKLQYRGFQIRSHHGETWKILRSGIQAVDNAMNIWHIDALEHGISLGINPNYYFHSLYQRVLRLNQAGKTIPRGSQDWEELCDMQWHHNHPVLDKILAGDRLNAHEIKLFTKTKFHTALEVEHYQHDVLNRMIHKGVSLMSLPSSNYKLTTCFEGYKDHPFSWWEKKGVKLGVGTDNYITLNTDFITEMLILLYMDPMGLKITKLLMITTGETRRPYISNLLWQMHSKE
ncbi:MAG: hypothetical protein QNK37_25160 [Acidobacteriota bacterium]|nr:hypothetical protein [Acidobacteriota bacterium]